MYADSAFAEIRGRNGIIISNIKDINKTLESSGQEVDEVNKTTIIINKSITQLTNNFSEFRTVFDQRLLPDFSTIRNALREVKEIVSNIAATLENVLPDKIRDILITPITDLFSSLEMRLRDYLDGLVDDLLRKLQVQISQAGEYIESLLQDQTQTILTGIPNDIKLLLDTLLDDLLRKLQVQISQKYKYPK